MAGSFMYGANKDVICCFAISAAFFILLWDSLDGLILRSAESGVERINLVKNSLSSTFNCNCGTVSVVL